MNNRINIYLPDELIKRLKEISKENYGVSVSKIVAEVVKEWLKNGQRI